MGHCVEGECISEKFRADADVEAVVGPAVVAAGVEGDEASVAAEVFEFEFFAGELERKGQTRAARKARTPSANRREKSGQ